jgi:2-desacetyl-2-hydroxyethyl bacteriochlorophyllide A dehydrogenase
MRAAVVTESHSFEVVDVPEPEPGPDDLVLRVRACGICGSDLKAYTAMPPGTVMGHEFCGEVVGVGSAVDDSWREGMHVAAMPVRACGRCRWCQAGDVAHCERADLVGVGGSAGGFAEMVRVDATATVALPPSVAEFGALVEPLAVGLHAVSMGDVSAGDRVLVLGGGSIGAAVTTWASRVGAAEVVVSDPVPSRRESAELFGATGVHDPADGAPTRSSFDVVVECVGASGMIQTAVDAAVTRGRVVVAGVCIAPDLIVPVVALMKELEVRFAVYYRRSEFFTAASLLARGAVDPGPFVSAAVSLDELDATFSRLASSTTERKILVSPGTTV